MIARGVLVILRMRDGEIHPDPLAANLAAPSVSNSYPPADSPIRRMWEVFGAQNGAWVSQGAAAWNPANGGVLLASQSTSDAPFPH